jgi:RNA polymerase sigma-70 factor (ECF subfamily)
MASRRRVCRNGKDGVLEAFVRESSGRALQLAYRLSGSIEDGQDIVQESLCRALRSWGCYDPSRPFAAWFYAILWNVFLDRKRANGHGHDLSMAPRGWEVQASYEGMLPDSSGCALDQLERRETAMLVRDALDRLRRDHKTVLVRHHLDGCKYREIAAALRVPMGTIRSRMYRAREQFRRRAGALESRA